MDSSSPEKLVRIRYAEVLRNLRSPAGSGKMIQNLTLLAEDQRQHAHIIASVILEEIPRSDIPRKYVLLCLVDSIVRKCRSGSIFFPYFLPYIAPYFAEAYTTKTSPQILRSLEKLLKVWSDSFPRDIVQKLISTTNNVRSKLNEPPIEIEANTSSVSSKLATSSLKSGGNLIPNTSVSNGSSGSIETLNTGMETAMVNEMYVNISKAIINKCNIKDGGKTLLNKLVLDPVVHKIAYLNTYGKIQESQKLMDAIVKSIIESKSAEHKHVSSINDKVTASKRQKQEVSVTKASRSPEMSSINQSHFNHSAPQPVKLIGLPSAVQQHMAPSQISSNQPVKLPIASNPVVPPSVSAAAAAAAAAAAVVQSKSQNQHQKHVPGILPTQKTIPQPITSPQQLSPMLSSSMPSSAINTSGISNNIKKTFSPRFLENSTSSILFSVWNQLFQSKIKIGSSNLKRITSSIIDGKGDQHVFLEGLQVKEISDLLLFYKRLQENVDASLQFKKSVWLRSHFIKKRIVDNINDFNLQANISMYYAERPNQCHTCGYRFIDNKKKESHIQIHLSKNLIFRQKKQNSNFQSLWPSLQDWIYSSDKKTPGETSIEVSCETKELTDDKLASTVNEKGNDFTNDGSHSNEENVSFNDLFNSLFRNKSGVRLASENEKDYSVPNDKPKEAGRFDPESNSPHQFSCSIRACKNVLLTQYINYLKTISNFDFESTLNKLSSINNDVSSDIYGSLLKDVDEICNNLSSLWSEMTQCVISTYTPVDHLHMICDICHESLSIKWCPINKSWISTDAVALTQSYNKESTFENEHRSSYSHNLVLAVVDTLQEASISRLSSIKEKINSKMLHFIQWKFPTQTSSSSNKVIEFRPFKEDCPSIGSGNMFVQNIVGDKFFTAHKSCFIHYFIYNDINNRISNVIKGNTKKYSYSIPNYHDANLSDIGVKIIQKGNENNKRFSFI